MSQVTHLADDATQNTNTTGEMTSILDYDPAEGTTLQIRNRVEKGNEAGVPVYFDLRDSSDNALPTDTDVVIRVDKPAGEQAVVVSEKLGNISQWNAMTMTEQRSEDNIDQVKVDLKGAVVNVRHVDTLEVAINSSAAVDWSNSELYVDGKATRKVDFQGE